MGSHTSKEKRHFTLDFDVTSKLTRISPLKRQVALTVTPKSDQIILALMFHKSFRAMLYISITTEKDLLFSTIADALACILSKSPLNIQLAYQPCLWCKKAQLVEKEETGYLSKDKDLVKRDVNTEDPHLSNSHQFNKHKEMIDEEELQSDERIYCYDDKILLFDKTNELYPNNVYLMHIIIP